jgi:hypothetical protein
MDIYESKQIMKKTFSCFFVALIYSISLMAQSKEPVSVLITEKGATGDLIIGKEIKKNLLSSSPELLQPNCSLPSIESTTPGKKKKDKRKKYK